MFLTYKLSERSRKMNQRSNYRQIKESYNGSDYVAVNGFRSTRRTSNLTELLSFYIDLDVINTPIFESIYSMFEYNDNLNDVINNEYLTIIKQVCIENKLPKPSRINYSGNGYHIYWDIKEYTTAEHFDKFYGASYRQKDAYLLINKRLVEIFSPLGADRKATDVARLLREEGSFNPKSFSACKEIYSNNKEVVFEDMANGVLKHTYKEVKNYKKITKKQKEFLKKNNLPMTKNKFTAQKTINEFIKQDNKATVKQINYLIKLGAKEIDIKNLNNYEANELINKLKPQVNYICNTLDKLYSSYKIKEGNRSMFYFYYVIGMRREEAGKEEVITKLEKFNKRLDLPKNELISIVNSAFREDINLNVRKSTIFKDLGISGKSIKRSKKADLNGKYERFKTNLSRYSVMSLRKVAEELEISKTTISNFKKKIKEEIEKLKELKNDQKEIMLNFVSNLFTKNQDKTLVDQVDFKKVEKCPQKIE